MSLSPLNNPDLFGHAAAEQAFLQSFNADRLPHAWMIAGPEGVGKTTLAYRIARFMLQQGQAAPGLFGEPDPLDSLFLAADDPLFTRVAHGGHLDLLVVERGVDEKTGKEKTVITIDDVREVVNFFSMTASEGGWRVAIVDGVEDMNRNAANALLKILEEPPQKCLLLLVTHAPGRLLPTLRSRCRRLDLRTLDLPVLQKTLTHFLPDISAQDIQTLSVLSDGRPGQALRLYEGQGIDLYRDLLGVLRDFPRFDRQKVRDFAWAYGGGVDVGGFRTTADMMVWTLSRVIRQMVRPDDVTPAVLEEPQILHQLGAARPLSAWQDMVEDMQKLFAQTMGLHLNRKDVLQDIFYQMAHKT